jgi:hypothetical protein
MTTPASEAVEPVEPAAEPAASEKAELSLEALQAELRRARDDAAKYRTKARELEPLAQKAKEAEEAQQTELERAANRLAELQAERDKATGEALRYRVAAAHQLKAEDFDLLGSGTEEELTARAERIAALYAAQVPPAPPAVPGRPIEQLRPGATPSDHESPDEATWRALGLPPVTTP